MFALTHHLWLHGNGDACHGEEGEDRLIKALVLKEISREVNREEIALGAHAGHMPERNVRLTYYKPTAAEHDAIYAWKTGKWKVTTDG